MVSGAETEAGLGLNTGASGRILGPRGLWPPEDDCWALKGFSLLKRLMTLSMNPWPWDSEVRDNNNTIKNTSLILLISNFNFKDL